MNMEFISRPALVRAIQFLPDGSNYDHVIDIVKLHGAHAELGYLKDNGQPAEKGTLTTNRAMILASQNGLLILPKGTWFILDSERSVVPMTDHDFKMLMMPLSEINSLGNGDHTFAQLYEKVSHYEPTLEEILVTDKIKFKELSPEVKEYIQSVAIIHNDSEGANYYVVNGMVYVLD